MSTKKIQHIFLLVLTLAIGCASLPSVIVSTNSEEIMRRPKLVIGITVDQMRFDYIEKYWNDYGNEGFKRLLSEGYSCRNMHYNYMPTYTGPGHASIFTGTTPAYHGIIQNDWYERSSGKMIYCSSDSTVSGVGTTSATAGKMSPQYLLSTTIGDELKIFSNNRSKVIGIAMKDRGAILTAGRTADAAYWFEGGSEGLWTTSTWYMNNLPQWVKDFNASGKAEGYMNMTWNMEMDENKYDESHADNNVFESPFKGTLRPVFPYVMNDLRSMNGNFDLIKATPFGNDMTVDFAKAVIENEQMGSDEHTDMLCMSFSSTDYIGHQFGIHARETQDCYIKLDKLIAEFINYLDTKIGKDNYTIFLSADHGGAPTPSYMMSEKATAGYWKSDNLEIAIEQMLIKKYGEGDWVLNESNQNIFLNRKLIEEKKMNLKHFQMEVADFVQQQTHVSLAFTASELNGMSTKSPVVEIVQLGFSQQMSGDVIYVLNPGYMEYGMSGTTHGSPWVYDTHVPAIFYGFGVKQGEGVLHQTITDIAPTVSSICRISYPNACIGQPIVEAVK
ncbi:MAG: alkaline phosphatase PafA [Flavobacteriales bacterium]